MLLEGRGLCLSRDARVLFDHLDVRVDAGEVVVIAGPSGGGKTTLLRVLAKLTSPDAGEVITPETTTPQAHRQRVSYVAQASTILPGTVYDNLAAGPALRGETLTRGAAAALLERVALRGAMLEQAARVLSGGELQRLALARALANAPRVLLLDEPTSALDPETAERVLRLIAELAREGMGIVAVSHVQTHAERMGTRLVTLRDGRLS